MFTAAHYDLGVIVGPTFYPNNAVDANIMRNNALGMVGCIIIKQHRFATLRNNDIAFAARHPLRVGTVFCEQNGGIRRYV